MSKQIKHFYEFGPFRIDTANRLLLCNGEPVPLKAKAIETLLLLVRHNGEVVEKEELMKQLWPDSFVEEANLTQNIYMLRKALGEGRFIETIPRRGYRFAAEVKEWEDTDLILIKEKMSTSFSYESETQNEIQAAVKEPTEELLQPHKRKDVGTGVGLRVLAASLTLGAVLIFASYLWRQSKSNQPDSEAPIRSVAVLPFKLLSPDGSDEYLGLGMTDTLITRLSGIGQMVVPSMNTVRKYADTGQDPSRVGQELKVDCVLEGSIQRSGDRLRVTVRLTRTSDSKPLWADKFDEQFTDIFKVEDSISERVVGALAVKLSGKDRELLAKRYTDNADAYQLYLTGRYFWNKRTEADLKKSIECFQRAINLDPNYALAYTGLADSYVQLPGYSATASMEIYPKAKSAVARALELDNTLAEAHSSAAGVLSYFEWDWAAAEEEYRKALSLNPNYAAAHHRLGVQLAAMGRFDEALAELKRAQELDPLSLITNTIWGATFYEARQYDQAIAQLQKTLELDINFAPAHELLGHTYEEKGMSDQAFAEYLKWRTLSGDSVEKLEALRKAYNDSGLRGFRQLRLNTLLEQAKHSRVQATYVAALYARLDEREQSFEWLERAVEQHDGEVVWLKVLPDFDNLHSDPRFIDLLKRVNLVQSN